MDYRPPGWKHLSKEGLEKYTEDVFFALGEVSILGMPVLMAVVVTLEYEAERTLGAIVALATLTLAVATVRSGRTRIGAAWPGFRPSTVLVRIVWYNLAFALAAYGGGAIDVVLRPGLGSVGFAAAVSIAAVVTLPWAADRTRTLVSWWTWGRPLP